MSALMRDNQDDRGTGNIRTFLRIRVDEPTISLVSRWINDDGDFVYKEVNRSEMDTKVFVDKETTSTMVPLRYVSELLGYDVTWDEITETATVTNATRTLKFKKDSHHMLIDGTKVQVMSYGGIWMDTIMKDNRLFIPLRAVSRAFDLTFGWDHETGVGYLYLQ